MDLQNTAYALTQVIHNFGAVAVVSAAIFGRWARSLWPPARRKLAWLVFWAWLIQGLSGLGFGGISYAYYQQLPDLHGIALGALFTKMTCAVLGILLSGAYLRYQGDWSEARQNAIWTGLVILGVIALTAAAFLRWFS